MARGWRVIGLKQESYLMLIAIISNQSLRGQFIRFTQESYDR